MTIPKSMKQKQKRRDYRSDTSAETTEGTYPREKETWMGFHVQKSRFGVKNTATFEI